MSVPMIDELERQIDDTRRALDRTLHTLHVELSPRHQLEQAWRRTRDRTTRSFRAGANWATANPVPLFLGAAALAAAAVYLGVVGSRDRR